MIIWAGVLLHFRPFLYIITDYAAEKILFIGKVGNPNEK